MKLSFFTFALMAMSSLASAADSGKDWEKIGEDSGIISYKRDVPGSPFVAFKGEGMIDAPFWKVWSVMADSERAPEWVDSLVVDKVIRTLGPLEDIEYNRIGTPFILKDRDFVVDVKCTYDAATSTATVAINSVTDPAAPETGYVRGVMTDSSFVLSSREGGQKTYLIAEAHVDPKGSVPPFIINLFQTGWAKNTIESIRKQVLKNNIKLHPTYATLVKLGAPAVAPPSESPAQSPAQSAVH